MKKVLVASQNPVKIEAVGEALSAVLNQELQLEGVSVESGVSDQPMSDEETLRGASNRVNRAQDRYPGYDFYVGLEGGVEESPWGLMAFAWIVIRSDGTTGQARTAGFFLPPRVAKLVHEGYELGDADDMVFGQKNSKQQSGAVGLLTNNQITRKTLYLPAVQLAFIPFMNPGLYP
jgi:inosine/xanthosine triphosphatase